jgi:hypothetical protein
MHDYFLAVAGAFFVAGFFAAIFAADFIGADFAATAFAAPGLAFGIGAAGLAAMLLFTFSATLATVFAAASFAAFCLDLLAAARPFTIGSSQQTISADAHPHSSSTTTTRPHVSQLNTSPFFAFAMLVSLLDNFIVISGLKTLDATTFL